MLAVREVVAAPEVRDDSEDAHNQVVREGSYEAPLVQRQASKQDPEQPKIASVLAPFKPATTVADVCVVGCGPAGLALSAELAAQGLAVALVGHDAPFVNNYGVWQDEFEELGLSHTLDVTWSDALCYFGEGQEVRVGRAYGRVCRRRLREHLLQKCQASGVQFLAGEVVDIDADNNATSSQLQLADGTLIKSRLITIAAGAAAGKFLQYEDPAPTVAAQTAYGIEAEVEGYNGVYDSSALLFMDFRRHHTGLWPNSAHRLTPGEHPASGEGLWGTFQEVPTFLYAMPISPGRVFLEETCLVAKPPLPFGTIKRRLERRLEAMGIKVKRIVEEEWSYIPVGGPLPLRNQPITAFGAAANLVHPATGYSIARSLREAPGLAQEVAAVLSTQQKVGAISLHVWEALWPQEKRRQAAFHVFGMELLSQLDLGLTNKFFRTFFGLPDFYWRGFLASTLSSGQLIAFALITFATAPMGIKGKLMHHLMTDPAGKYLVRNYAGLQAANDQASSSSSEAQAAAMLLMVAAAAALGTQTLEQL
ncbi:hypothetical protein WJX72_009604 [[Myrmecia] bisecta]|uniref:Lycopene epsilon cyclase n=1 Tax=[Myrmecia] bisecta TaxID=41462 RepID=A0AAW1Q2V1_9CHLO